uniref:Choline/carnitine acyltransferase domain-containing protein n=1 Tax=Ciona savignyi TaxID=51511 RepID=H2Z317_CIOSA
MADADRVTSNSKSDIRNPGIFTTTDRTKWAKIRNQMLLNRTNHDSIKIVESSAFCFVLSENCPKNHSEEFRDYLTGSGFDRWFDKSFTFIVNKNGSMGFNVEHSTTEATLGGRMLEYALFHSKYDADGNPADPVHRSHPSIDQPKPILWELDEYDEDITELKKEWGRLANNLDALVYYMPKGKGMIKKLRVSPDGFIQMAMQLAFYRERQVTPKTYETAATRLFKFGRTETIRPVSTHSVAFTKCFDDPSATNEMKILH